MVYLICLQLLGGFSSLVNIDGEIIISTNKSLTNLDGFSSLSAISGSLVVQDNGALNNIDELHGLNFLAGNIRLNRNNLLENINGLQNITSLSGSLFIEDNESLNNIDGLIGLDSLEGQITISRNGLHNIDGLGRLKHLTGSLKLIANHNLIDINGLSGLSSLDGYLEIKELSGLKDVNGLFNLRTIDGRLILEENGILDLNGLWDLESINGHLEIQGNSQLTQCCSLQNIYWSGDYFCIELSSTNGAGCQSKEDVLVSECDDIKNTSIRVYADDNNNCIKDPEEEGLKNIPIRIGNKILKSTDSLGLIETFLLPGDYNISADLQNDIFTSCHNDFIVEMNEGDQIEEEIPVHPILECSDLSLGMSTPFLRRCFDNQYVIEVNNSSSLV